jgi:hypothetical protein
MHPDDVSRDDRPNVLGRVWIAPLGASGPPPFLPCEGWEVIGELDHPDSPQAVE